MAYEMSDHRRIAEFTRFYKKKNVRWSNLYPLNRSEK